MPTSLGPAEIMVILVVALIVLGPSRLPEAGRQVGKALAEVRRWTRDVQGEIRGAIDPNVATPAPSSPSSSVSAAGATPITEEPAAVPTPAPRAAVSLYPPPPDQDGTATPGVARSGQPGSGEAESAVPVDEVPVTPPAGDPS